jgi:hypothetical protein
VSVDKIQFVAEQLKAIAPDADWMQGGIDRAREMAQIFVRSDITDLWALKLIPVTVKENRGGYFEENEAGSIWIAPQIVEVKTYAFDYYGRQIGYLGTQDRADNEPVLQKVDAGYIIGWSSAGKGHINYLVHPNQQLKRLQIIPKWESSSDADAIRGALITAISFFAFTALPMAGISVGASIGNAILPASITAAYPAAASIVGNVALSAALNGSDVKSAVVNAVSSGIGAGAGGWISGAVDSNLVGSLASAATTAAIRGESIKDALASAAISEGMTTMFNFDFGVTDPYFTDAIGGGSIDYGFTLPPLVEGGAPFTPTFEMQPGFADGFWQTGGGGLSFDWSMDGGLQVNQPINIADFDFGTNPFLPVLDVEGGGLNPTFNPVGFDPLSPDGQQFLTQSPAGPVAPTTAPPPSSSIWTPQQVVQAFTAAGMAVISLVKAYRQLDMPRVQPVARNVNPDGSVSVVGNNGLIQTRKPDGTIVTTTPPVGVPQATISGNYVVNNGDGTYTVVSPTGQSQTIRYGVESGAGGLSLSTLALIGAGLFLIARK